MKRPILVALTLLATLAFTALGVWQVERRAWKLDLIARVEARIHAPPVAPPNVKDWPRLNPRDEEYRRVTVTGTPIDGRDTLVQAVTVRGAGFWLLTPVRTDDGVIIVNRGFVPPDKHDSQVRWLGKQGVVTATGLMRMSEPGGGFLRDNDPAGNRWYSRDVAAIAKARGLGEVAPFFVDADATPNPGVYPIGGLTVVRFNNNHLVYALTWFGLAGLSVFAAFLSLRSRVR